MTHADNVIRQPRERMSAARKYRRDRRHKTMRTLSAKKRIAAYATMPQKKTEQAKRE